MWLIRNVHVVDPAQSLDEVCDVRFDRTIIDIRPSSSGFPEDKGREGLRTFDAEGKYLFPGLVDAHVHLREPGREDKEDIASGARAAVRGGFTSIMAMANTTPAIDTRGQVEFVLRRGRQAGGARVYPAAALTKGRAGTELVEMVELKRSGAIAFSDDGNGIQQAETMRLALQYAQLTGCPIIAHCEDDSLAARGVMRRGQHSARLGMVGIPAAAESVMVARDILLAKENGGKVHFAHLSTAESIELIRRGKAWGLDLTAEVNPHHLIFCDSDVDLVRTEYKVNPPLPSAEDRDALLAALLDGTIDMLATDHAPHTWEEKNCPFPEAPFGINALETALAAVWTYLVHPGKLPKETLIRSWSWNPARRFNLPGGSLKPGQPADLILFDPQHEEVIGEGIWLSKATNTPFWGQRLRGFAVAAWIDGKIMATRREDLTVDGRC